MNARTLLDWDDGLLLLQSAIASYGEKLAPLCGTQAVVVLRDWRGKLTVCLPCSRDALVADDLLKIGLALAAAVGPLAGAEDLTVCKDELFDPDDIWISPDLVFLGEASGLWLQLLDRQDKEGDWLREPPSTTSVISRRAIFFGVKGGVGRSSALIALALQLANSGKNILIVDADFESPGVSSSLLGDAKPEYGLVDWLTADALGCVQEELDELATKNLTETSPLSQLTKGRILVSPSYGIRTQSYISKLGRVYRTTPEGHTFSERLQRVIATLERVHSTDVTLIDSRAGIDDTSAAAVTQLSARVAFLFAVNTKQTWDAYSILFKHLQRHPTLHLESDFRSTLKFVSALTPEEVGAYKGYWSDFLDNAYDTCATLYDVDDGSGDPNVYSPAPDDHEAPHFAAKVMWHEVLRAFDPVKETGQVAPALLESVFGNFLSVAVPLLEGK